MSFSQLGGKGGINYAKLRHRKSPNDQLTDDLFEIRKPSVDTIKHTRAKSTLGQSSYRTPQSGVEEGEKLFDQFFKLNNSKSDGLFGSNDFIKFLDRTIEYHKSSESRFFRPTVTKAPQLEQKLKEALISNRILANDVHKMKQREHELKLKLKHTEKQLTKVHLMCQQKEQELYKQKYENEEIMNHIKTMIAKIPRCVCQQNREYWQNENQQTHFSSELSSNTLEDLNDFKYLRRRSLSKTSEEQQDSLGQSYMKNKNSRDFHLFRKKQYPDPYYIEEEHTINST